MYLVWAPEGQTAAETRRRMLDECAPRLLALGPERCSMDLDDPDADVPSPLPPPEGERQPAAVVSIWLRRYEDRAPFEDVLADFGDRLAGYLVTESLYTDYGDNRWSAPRDWPDGTRSPGVLTVALMQQPPEIDDDEWFERWHGRQSPMSEAMQPRARYVRNTVARVLTPDAPPLRGIVEESWPTVEHLVDPMLFYGADGSEERLHENVRIMLEHVTAFLDLATLRNLTMSEYLLRS